MIFILRIPHSIHQGLKVLDATGIEGNTTLFLESFKREFQSFTQGFMSRDQDVEDIIKQLQDLQVRQTALISRLVRSSTSGNESRAPPPPPDAPREFPIGDRVRIRNPRVLQANRGTIIRIGNDRITVLARNGNKIVRKPKNLILKENE